MISVSVSGVASYISLYPEQETGNRGIESLVQGYTVGTCGKAEI